MNQQENFDRFESACDKQTHEQYLAQFVTGEELTDIEQEFWDDLNFNDIYNALAKISILDEQAFVRAMQGEDSNQVFNLLQNAIQIYIEQCAEKKYV